MQYQSTEKSKQQSSIHTNIYYDYSSINDTYAMANFVAILSYITLFGWFAAIVLHGSHKSNFTRFHLRQSLGLIITGALLALIPLIGWLLYIGVFFAWLWALYFVIQGQEKKVPLLGDFYQNQLDFIK